MLQSFALTSDRSQLWAPRGSTMISINNTLIILIICTNKTIALYRNWIAGKWTLLDTGETDIVATFTMRASEREWRFHTNAHSSHKHEYGAYATALSLVKIPPTKCGGRLRKKVAPQWSNLSYLLMIYLHVLYCVCVCVCMAHLELNWMIEYVCMFKPNI